jgi:predicted RecB family nuclease
VLFHEGERPTREQRALLELLGHILGAAQGKEPEIGVLVHGRECVVRRLKLPPGGRRAERTLQDIREKATPPRLVLNNHCQVCEFRQRCHTEAAAKDDLSLLRGLSEKEINKCGRRGILTVTQLSYTFRPRNKSKRSKQKGQPHHHALQALALREKKIHVLGNPELPACSTRIYLDIEGDPERGFDYLVGLIVEANGAVERHSFWADTPAEEPRLLQQILDVVGRHEDYRIYTYGSYEAAFLRRVSKGSGREELAERLLARWVNVLSVVHTHVYFPTYSNGLKDVAGYLAVRWTEANASGVQSVVWRRRWEETGSAALKEMLATYNLEDCAALQSVTECLYAICSREATTVGAASPNGHAVLQVEEMTHQSKMHGWNNRIYAVPDFRYINDRASFDYQRDRVSVDSGSCVRCPVA